MPLIEALIQAQGRERVSGHMPGHKGGRALPPVIARHAGAFAAWDVTELPGTDDLYAPTGPLREAQSLAARAFGSDGTLFLVGGSTAGMLASILALLRPGEKALVARDSHQSVWHALELADARAVPLWPAAVSAGGLTFSGTVTGTTLERALARHPDARCLIVTSPTYFGFAADLRELAAIAHAAGVAVIVDEAHGAHLPFHPDLPESALAAGADVVVHSAHKMTAALTQTAFLHWQGKRVDPRRLLAKLRLVQTSSPSYLLLASLDAVRSQLAVEGEKLLADALQALEQGADRMRRRLPGVLVLPEPAQTRAAGWRMAFDPFKWTLDARALNLSGYGLQAELCERGVAAELSDACRVLFLWSYATCARDLERLVDALEEIAAKAPPVRPTADVDDGSQTAGVRGAGCADAGDFPEIACREPRASRRVALQEAVGYRLAEPLTVYPPGIPLVLRGETLSADMAVRVAADRRADVRIDGLGKDMTVAVWREADL